MSSIFIIFSSSERVEDKKNSQSYEFVKGFMNKGIYHLKNFKNYSNSVYQIVRCNIRIL